MKKFFFFLVFSPVIGMFNMLAQVPENGLVAFYPFTGNANDESGNGNNGVVNGATLTTDRCGNENSAYYFDGADDEITVPNNDLIDFSNAEDFTITCWMNSTDERWVSVINKQYPGYSNGYYLELNNGDPGYCTSHGHIMFYVAAGAYEDACSDGIVNNGEWKFIAGVYHSVQNKVSIYIDGILQTDIGQASGDIKTFQNLLIGYGYSFDPGNHHYKGSIDDIRIYNRTLSDQEIVALYNDGCNTHVSPNPLAYYPFNGNANDESGNGHDGLMHNVTLTTDMCGNENSACYFNGYDSYVELTNTCGLNMFDGFSLAAWVNFTETNGSSIVSKHVNYYANGFTMSACDNIFNLTTNNNQYYLSTSETYNDGNWHFAVGTFTGNTLSIYVDGQLKASAAADYTNGNGINIRIGADYYLSFFNGLIDEVMIFDRALSNSEVALLYSEAACQQYIPETGTGSLNIYPNPAREQIIVHIDNALLDQVLKIEIRNILGQVVYAAPVVQEESVIDISFWIGYGIYFIRLKDPEGEIIESRKLLLF